MKKILTLALGIACVPFLVFGADKPYIFYTAMPHTKDSRGNPVSWCGPCNQMKKDLADQLGPDWENFVEVVYVSTIQDQGNGPQVVIMPGRTDVPPNPLANNGTPYLGKRDGNVVKPTSINSIKEYKEAYQETMRRKMEEAAAKAKELAKPKELPASRVMPPAASAPKLPDILTFSVKPVDPKDLSKGFIVLDGKGKPIVNDKGDELRLDVPGPTLNTLIGTYAADPTATYEMNTKTGALKLPDAGTVVMPRLRPVPDTVLPYLNTPVAVRTETVDGITYQIFKVIIPTPSGIDKEGNPIYSYVEKELRVRIPAASASAMADVDPPTPIAPSPTPQSTGFFDRFLNNLLGRSAPAPATTPPERIPGEIDMWTPVLPDDPADPVTAEQEAALKKKYEEYMQKMRRNMEEGVKNAKE